MIRLFLLLTLCTAPWPAWAGDHPELDADSVAFTGISRYDQAKARNLAGLRPGTRISAAGLDSCLARLIDSYNREGFYRARAVVKPSEDGRSALLEVIEGPRVVIGRIIFSGNEQLSQSFLAGLIRSGSGQLLDSAMLASDLMRVSLAYADHGFPQAEVWLKSLRLSGDSLELAVGIKENALVRIGDVIFRGNKITRSYVIQRLGGGEPGRVFSREWLEKYRERLEASGLFTSVKQAVLLPTPEPGLQHLRIEVEEARYNRFFGTAAYNQPDPSQPGWLAGMVDIRLGNIAGTARSAALRWERPRKQNSRLEAGYQEPWLMGFEIGADLSLSHRVEDSSYVQSSAGLMLKVSAGLKLTAGMGGSVERVVPGTSQSYRRSLKYSSLWVVQSTAPFESSGRLKSSWMFKADIGQKRYYQPESKLSVGRLWGDLTYVLELDDSQQLYGAGRGRLVVSGERPVPRYDQFSMGGTGSLRGYHEEQFTANHLLWANLEYRYKPVRNLTALLFADAGYFYDRERGLRGYRTGYGFGTHIMSKIGSINVYYGLGDNDKLLNGKVHFVLENIF